MLSKFCFVNILIESGRRIKRTNIYFNDSLKANIARRFRLFCAAFLADRLPPSGLVEGPAPLTNFL